MGRLGCWAARLLSLSTLKQKRIREKKEKERVRVREKSWTLGLFSRTHKNELEPGKIEVGTTKSLNSNSFDFNSNECRKEVGIW